MDTKKNGPLIVGLSIPVLMILFVAASIYLPGLFVQPKVNFLYSLGGDYYSPSQYYVLNGKIALRPVVQPEETKRRYSPKREIHLYFHDVVRNQSREISMEEAQIFTLDSGVTSPDGFKVTREEHGGSIFALLTYRSDGWGTQYISGHNVGKKLNIPSRDNSYRYYGDFEFLGWVIE